MEMERTHPLCEHDYSVRLVAPKDLPKLKSMEAILTDLKKLKAKSKSGKTAKRKKQQEEEAVAAKPNLDKVVTKKFAKCDKCRKSRTKVLVPDSLMAIAHGKNDGVTCDFCGDVMTKVELMTLPDTFEGRRGSKGGGPTNEHDVEEDIHSTVKGNDRVKHYVYCGECGKVVLKESLNKHLRDVHEKSNKRECPVCSKVLSGPFSLKEHISAVHNKVTKHQCPKCDKTFAHFSNMNRHVRLVHDKSVVTHKYVNCSLCSRVVQATSLKKHMAAIHEKRRDHVCKFCKKAFAQSYTLKEHIVAKHTLNYDHECKLCMKLFAHKTNAVRHLRTVHRNELAVVEDIDLVKKYIQTNDQSIEEDDNAAETEGHMVELW